MEHHSGPDQLDRLLDLRWLRKAAQAGQQLKRVEKPFPVGDSPDQGAPGKQIKNAHTCTLTDIDRYSQSRTGFVGVSKMILSEKSSSGAASAQPSPKVAKSSPDVHVATG
jgi:hypothetical protein